MTKSHFFPRDASSICSCRGERKREIEIERESEHIFPRIERSIFDRKVAAAYEGMSGSRMSRVMSQKDRVEGATIISR